jgi:hypothetical protein
MPANGLDDQATRKIGATLTRAPLTGTTRQPDVVADEEDDSFSFVITPPVTRRPVEQSPVVAAAARPAARGDRSGRRPQRRPRPTRRLLGWALSLAVLGVGSLAAIALLVPTATVTLIPTTAQVTADFTYGVSDPSAAYDVEVDPRPVTVTLTFTASIPTTGQRFVPDGTATGALLLTNPTTDELLLPAGTSFVSDTGVSFATTEDVLIPAADPFGSRSFGSAEVGIVADVAGPDGNVAAEAIYGQLDNGVFFANQAATTGGTVKRIATVTQVDLDLLKGRAVADLQGRASGAMQPELQAGEQLLDGSLHQGEIDIKFDRAVNADATSVSVHASLPISGLAYSLDTLAQQARDAAGKRLAAQAGGDRVLLADTVTIGQPEPIAGAPTPAFRVHASGTVRAMLDQRTLDTLRGNLVGKSADQAEGQLRGTHGIAEYGIDYSPGWLPKRLPFMKDRIKLVVDNAATSQTHQTTTTGP